MVRDFASQAEMKTLTQGVSQHFEMSMTEGEGHRYADSSGERSDGSTGSPMYNPTRISKQAWVDDDELREAGLASLNGRFAEITRFHWTRRKKYAITRGGGGGGGGKEEGEEGDEYKGEEETCSGKGIVDGKDESGALLCSSRRGLEDFGAKAGDFDQEQEEASVPSEPLQVVQYSYGGHYHSHHDSHRRLATVLMYLNTVSRAGGGQTNFPYSVDPRQGSQRDERTGRARRRKPLSLGDVMDIADRCEESCQCGLNVTAEEGKAVIFYNLHYPRSNEEDMKALHAGCNVLIPGATKLACNKWFLVPEENDRP